MHNLVKHIVKNIGISLFLVFSILFVSNANSEQSIEDVVKERKAIFSKNYKTAKKVHSLSAKGKLEEASELMIKMSKNYIKLLDLFPENSIEGFKTGALPSIWEEKEAFNQLMKKSSEDMVELASLIKTTDDINGTIKKLMWSNCKACHSKYREEH